MSAGVSIYTGVKITYIFSDTFLLFPFICFDGFVKITVVLVLRKQSSWTLLIDVIMGHELLSVWTYVTNQMRSQRNLAVNTYKNKHLYLLLATLKNITGIICI